MLLKGREGSHPHKTKTSPQTISQILLNPIIQNGNQTPPMLRPLFSHSNLEGNTNRQTHFHRWNRGLPLLPSANIHNYTITYPPLPNRSSRHPPPQRPTPRRRLLHALENSCSHARRIPRHQPLHAKHHSRFSSRFGNRALDGRQKRPQF